MPDRHGGAFCPPTLDAVRELVRLPGHAAVPPLATAAPDLKIYDRLLGKEVDHA